MKTALVSALLVGLCCAMSAAAAIARAEVLLPATYDISSVAIDAGSGDLIFVAFDFNDGATLVVRRDKDTAKLTTLYRLVGSWGIEDFSVRAGRIALGLAAYKHHLTESKIVTLGVDGGAIKTVTRASYHDDRKRHCGARMYLSGIGDDGTILIETDKPASAKPKNCGRAVHRVSAKLIGIGPTGRYTALYSQVVGVNLELLATREYNNVALEKHRLLVADRDLVVVRNLANGKRTNYNPADSEFDVIYGADLDASGRVLITRHALDESHDIKSATVELYPNADDATKHSNVVTVDHRLLSSGFVGNDVLTIARATNGSDRPRQKLAHYGLDGSSKGTVWTFAAGHGYGGGSADVNQMFFIDNGGSPVDKPTSRLLTFPLPAN